MEEDHTTEDELHHDFYKELMALVMSEKYHQACPHCLMLQLTRAAGQVAHAGGVDVGSASIEGPAAMLMGYKENAAMAAQAVKH